MPGLDNAKITYLIITLLITILTKNYIPKLIKKKKEVLMTSVDTSEVL